MTPPFYTDYKKNSRSYVDYAITQTAMAIFTTCIKFMSISLVRFGKTFMKLLQHEFLNSKITTLVRLS